MIKVKNGKCKIKAKNGPDMMVDFAMICKSIYELLKDEGIEKEDAKAFMKHGVDLATCETDEELEDCMKKEIARLNKHTEEKGE